MRIPVVVLLLTLSASAREPYFVIVDGGRQAKPARQYVRSLIEHFELKEHLLPTQLATLEAKPHYQLETNEVRFTTTTGIAYFSTTDREPVRTRFWTVPNEATFHRFLEAQRAKRGERAEIFGQDNRLRIHAPPQHAPDRTIRWQDAYAYYEDGLFVWGSSPRLHSLSLRPLNRVVRSAKGKHNFVRVDMSAADTRNVQEVLRDVEREVKVRLQKRDQEPIDQFEKRRTMSQARWMLFNTLLTGLETATIWTEWPGQVGGHELSGVGGVDGETRQSPPPASRQRCSPANS